MADISQSNWREDDVHNDAAAPDGAPEGMAPAGVNDTMRAMMGGVKRFWDRINGTVKTTKVGNAYTYAGTVVAPSLVDGEIYTFRANAANTGAATLNVGVGGSQALVKANGVDGVTSLIPNDILPGCYYMAAWDSLSTQFVVMNPVVTDAAIRSTSAVIKADISSVSAVVGARLESDSAIFAAALGSIAAATEIDFRSVSVVIKADISSVSAVLVSNLTGYANAGARSTSADIKADISSVSAVITTAYTANDHSVSAVVKADIASVSAVLQAAINAIKIPTGFNMFFYNNAAPSGWIFIAANDFTLITQNTVGNGGVTGGAWAISGLSVEDANHTHNFTVDTGNESVDKNSTAAEGGSNTYAGPNHHHFVNGATTGISNNHSHNGDGSWRPLHLKVILCQRT